MKKYKLEPGEEKTVIFTLDKRAFAYYNTEIKDWYVESGEFELLVGKSSKDIILKEKVKVNSTKTVRNKFHRNSTIGDLMEDPVGSRILKELMQDQISEIFPVDEHRNEELVLSMMKYLPLRGLINFGRGKFTEEMLEELLKKLNQQR